MKTIKVAAIQPRSYWGEDEYKNAIEALSYLEEAAKTGAQLVTFPEAYPGPGHGPIPNPKIDFDPIEALCQKAREYGVYVAASNVEPNPEIEDTFFLTQKLISPEGKILANYKRSQPDHPHLNAYLHGGRKHMLPGNEIVVVPTEIGNIGLQICSELYGPEITRIQMLMGADIIISPVNGQHQPTMRTRLTDTWRCIVRARAAENLLFVIVTQNIFYDGARGVGIIASPEGPLAQNEGIGIITATLDFERLHYLRTKYYDEDIVRPPDEDHDPIGCRVGQIHDRRPEMYSLLTAPQEDAFNYFYYKDGLDSYYVEYERIKKYYVPKVGS